MVVRAIFARVNYLREIRLATHSHWSLKLTVRINWRVMSRRCR